MSTFSLMISLGALAGLVMVAMRAPKKLAARYVDAGLVVLVCALVGSRLVFALTNWGYFRLHPSEIYQVWLGGLSASGALLGAFTAILILRAARGFFPGPLADGLLPLLGSLSIAAWLGCWIDGSAYGHPTTAWYALPASDEWGAVAGRLPVQLLGALLTLIVFVGLEQARGRYRQPGMVAGLGLLGWAMIFFGLSFLRADPAQAWQGLRLEAWGALGVAGVGLASLLVGLLRYRMKSKER
jgi:phosphatidylglycerol:prolipoprotein diacylglycerol transferase